MLILRGSTELPGTLLILLSEQNEPLFKRLYSLKSNKEARVKSDQIGKHTGFYVSKVYPEKLRRVKFYDKESDRTFVFLSNNFELSAEEIAFLYKNR